MKNFKLYLLLILICVLFTACSKDSSKKETTKPSKKIETSMSTTSEEKGKNENSNKEVAVKATEESIKKVTEKASPDYSDIAKHTKDYILNGQKDVPDSQKINWNKTFLNKLNLTDLYKNYLSDGGTKDNIQGFAKYITKYAPVPSNWEELTNDAILNMYDRGISYTKHLNGDMYQIYVEIDGSDEPLYVVNCRTGYYHG